MELVNSGQNFSISNVAMEFIMRNKGNNLTNCYGYSLDEHLQSGEQSCNMPTTNFFFHNISKAKNREGVPFLITGNIKKKFENFTRYINSKEHSLLRETMDDFDKMSLDYSDFISSQRGYSDVSNSIVSYLIGGFVGSKSQMNNKKHKLSYDLGGAIFKILQDCKFDRSYDKLREDKKFETSKFGKKPKFKDSNGFLHDIVYRNNLRNQENDTKTEPSMNMSDCKIGNVISMCGNTEVESANNENCPVIIVEEEKCDIKTMLTPESVTCEEIDGESMCLNTSFVDLTNEIKEPPSGSPDGGDQSVLNNCKDAITCQSNQCEIDQMIEPVISNSLLRVNCLSLGIRRRQFSECSDDSTDSFIVFDDKCCIERQSSILLQCENDESDYSFEENGTSESSDDDDECCWIESNDEYDKGVEDREVAEANAKWSESYKDVDKDVDNSERRVRFKDEVTVHRMVAWDYAYRAARPGPWEQMAHDRGRFKARIQRLSSVISPILFEVHRKSVYNKLYP